MYPKGYKAEIEISQENFYPIELRSNISQNKKVFQIGTPFCFILCRYSHREKFSKRRMVQDARFFGTLGVRWYSECRKTGKQKAQAPSMGVWAFDNYDI